MVYILHYRYHDHVSDLNCEWGDPSFALEQTQTVHRMSGGYAEILDGALMIRCKDHSEKSLCGIMTIEDTNQRKQKRRR